MLNTKLTVVVRGLGTASAIALMASWANPALAQEATTEAPATTQAPVAAPGEASNDIVVTARRREENLQDVPVSIVAFSQAKITENAIASAADLGRVSPGLLSYPGAAGLPTQNSFSIRGRGLSFGAAAGSVETYFAEVPLSSNYNMPELPPQFFDVASVQVLKGPQGTLFGRSTTGGAVLIQPAAPTNNWEGYGRVQLGNYNNVQVEGAVNIPVIDDVLAIRVAGQHWKRDGYMTMESVLPADVQSRLATDPGFLTRFVGSGTTYANGQVRDAAGRLIIDNGVTISPITGRPTERTKYNNRDTTDLRGTIRFTPGDRFENSTIVTYHRDRNFGGLTGGLLLVRDATGAAVGGEVAPGAGTYSSYGTISPRRPKSEALAIINTTSLELTNSLKLRNIFGYIRAEGYTLDFNDSDASPSRTVDNSGARRPRLSNQYTNEVQLQGSALDDRLEFTVGGLIDLLREPRSIDRLNTASVSVTFLPSAGSDPAFPNADPFLTRFQSTNVTSRSLYGSATYKLTDQLSLTGGYRHIWDKVSAVQANAVGPDTLPLVYIDANPDVPGFQQTRRLSSKFQGDVYNAGIDYKASRDLLLYAGYRHGFKRGGFNNTAFGNFPAGFDPEQVDSFSVGAKTEFTLGGDVRGHFNIEGFYDKYKGYQGFYLDADRTSGNIVTITTNIPKVRYTGFDADLGLTVRPGIDLNLSYSFLDSKIQSFPDTTSSAPNLPSLEVNNVPYAVKHQVQASVRFHGEADGIGEWALRPSVSYRSKYYTILFNRLLPAAQRALFGNFDDAGLGGATVPGVTLVDLRAELNKIADSNFSLAVGATNLLNKYYYSGGTGTFAFGYQTYAVGAPRMVYGEVSYRF